MLRVCHVISGDLWAGAEVMAWHLLQDLATRPEVCLKIFLLNEGRLASELQKLGIQVEVLPEKDQSFITLVLKLRSSIAEFSPDVIHSHRYKENLLALLATRFATKVCLVATQHGLPETTKEQSSFAKVMVSKANMFSMRLLFDKTIAVSDSIYRFFIEEHGFIPKKVEVIRNGIEVGAFCAENRSWETFVIGSSGRLFPVKGFPLLVEIARLLPPRSEIAFSLAGEGPERKTLEDLLRNYSLADIFQLKGQVNDMASFYKGLKIYLNTSLHEGIPMTILEAMAQGLPIIAPKVGGIPEIIDDGVEGFLIEGRDPESFAEKCLQLYRDRDLWERMSRAARNRVCRDFSAAGMADRYLQCYRSLLA